MPVEIYPQITKVVNVNSNAYYNVLQSELVNINNFLNTGTIQITGVGEILVTYNNSGSFTVSQISGSLNASGTSILGSNITFSGLDLTQPTLNIYGTGNFNNGINITGKIIYNGTGLPAIPNNTSTPVSWMPITYTGINYYIPLYR